MAPAAVTDIERLDEDEIAAALAPAGPISRSHPLYEDRPTQRDMARAVARAYNDGGIAVLEAGTGTGKSVAYLVPAVRWAALNGERTVVSTNTINLQEQLVAKDLPFLRRSLGIPFRFALVKGRHNYISIRRSRLAMLGQAELFDAGQHQELEAIAEWARHTRDGSLQELPFTPSPEVWDEVVSDSDVCLGRKCPLFEQCFYQRARRDAALADVLVVNHHLLFSDLAVRAANDNYDAQAVLPPYRRVVLDEAHNLEDAATSHFGAIITRRGLVRLLGRLDRRGRGVLSAVEAKLRAGSDDMIQQDALRVITDELRPRIERAREHVFDLFERLEAIVAAAEGDVVRLHDDFTGEPEWADGPEQPLEDLRLVLSELAHGVHRLRDAITIDERWKDAMQEQLVELQGVRARLFDAVAALRIALDPASDDYPLVRWLERRGVMRDAQVAARAAPIDLSQSLRERLFERVDTAVLTSATLSIGHDFEFMRGRLGLSSGFRVEEAVFASPFAFEEQTLVAIPTDFPLPRDAADRFDSMVAAATEDHARLCDGGLFVLFTSYRSMRAVAARLRQRGVEGRWPLFVQGEAPRARLLERFVGCNRGILLGVASFWEGVDVPGEPLRGLVIAKLPFKVPTEPVTAARIEAIERAGGSSFAEYMLPLAALRLKQGFGRLVRTRLDRGAIAILDRRVLERGYGRHLLAALPPSPVCTGKWSELRERLREFYLHSSSTLVVRNDE